MMLATDKVHQDIDQRKNGKDPPQSDSSASWNDKVFKDRLQRFKKASGQTVPTQRLKKAKSKAASGNKSNSSDRCNIKKTSTHKYNIQRQLTEKCDIQKSIKDKCDIQKLLTDKCDIQKSIRDKCDIQRLLADKCDIQRLLADKCDIQRLLADKCDIQKSIKAKCDIQRLLTDSCKNPRTFTDGVKAAKNGVQGPVSVSSQAAEFRRQLQNSHNRQRLLATLAFAEREKKEEECGYRLSSNGVLVSTRKTDIYKNVDLFARNTEDETSRVVLASGESADVCKTNTSDELEDEGDYDTDGDEKLTNDSLKSHCKETYSKDYKYNRYNTVNMLPEGNKFIDEKCSKEISGSKLKVRYIFDSAELECYDYCFGKNSFVPTDYIGSYKVQRAQSPKLTKCNAENVRKKQEDTEKAIIVPDEVISEASVKRCAPREEKIQATRKEWLEGVQERRASAEGHQDIVSVNDASEDKEGPNFTCRLEMKYTPSISVFQEDKSHKEVTGVLEMQDKRLQTELTKYMDGKEDTSVFEHEVSKSVMESTECEEDSDVVCENNHQCAVKDNQELRTGNPELRKTLELQDGGEEHQEPDILLAKHEKKNIRYPLVSKEVCDEIQTMHSTLESQFNDINKHETGSQLLQNDNATRNKHETGSQLLQNDNATRNKHETGSQLLQHDNATRKLSTGCSLLSHDVFDPQDVERNSDLQEDTLGSQEMRFVLDNSDDVVGNNSSGSDIPGTKFVLMPNHTGGESRGAECVSQQHEGFKDIDKGCVSSQQGDFEDNHDECVPKQHWDFEDNDAECVSRKQKIFQDNDYEYVCRPHGNFEDIGVGCISKKHGHFEDNGVGCISKKHGHFEDNGVEYVSRQHDDFEDNGVECVSRQHQNFEDNGVECVSRQHENFEDNEVECLSRQHKICEDNNAVRVSQPHAVFEDSNVECVSHQHKDLMDNDKECFSRQHGGFKNTGVEFFTIHNDDLKDDNSDCVCKPHEIFVDNNDEGVGGFKNSDIVIVSKQHQGFKHIDVESVPKLHGGFGYSDVESFPKQHRGFEYSDVESVPKQQGGFEYSDVDSVHKQQGGFEQSDVESVPKQHGDFGDNDVESVPKQHGGFGYSDVESVPKQHGDFEYSDVESVPKQHRGFGYSDVKSVPKQHGGFGYSDVESVPKQHGDFEYSDVESVSKQHGGFEYSDVESVPKQHGGFEHSDVESVPKQHAGFKNNDVGGVSSQQGVSENNNIECVDRQHAGIAANYDVELVTGHQDCMDEYHNVVYISRPRKESEEGHKQCIQLNKKREIVNELHKDMESDTHGEVKHGLTEKSTDRNNDIHKSSETKCLQSNIVAADIGNLVNHVQERSAEQEQYSHDGNISPVSCNKEYETASEDETSKGDLARELVCFNEIRSGDRKYASPYSKFQQCHEDILKRLIDHCDDPFESENGEFLSRCEYNREETDDKTDEETNEETNEETDKDNEEDPCYNDKPRKLNTLVPEDNEAGCYIVHFDTIQKESDYVGAQKCSLLIQSIARCENKLEDRCHMKNRCARRSEMEDKVQAGYRMISSDVEDIKENTNQDLHIHRTKEDTADYTGEKIFRETQVMNCIDETVSPFSSTTCCSIETLKLQVVKNHESRASPASTAIRPHSCLAHCDTRRDADDNVLEDNWVSSKVECADEFVPRHQQDNCVNNDEKSVVVLKTLQIGDDRSRIDIEKNSTPISSPKDNKRTPESSRASASILEETSGGSISPQYSSVNSRNESTKQRTSQASSRSEYYSRNIRHPVSDVSHKYSPDIGIARLFNASDSDSNTPTSCKVQHSGEAFATSPDQCESSCHSRQPSKSQIPVPVRHKDLVNADGTYPQSAGYFPHYREYDLAYESDYNKQNIGIHLQADAVNNITDEKPVGKTSMNKLATLQEPKHTSINQIHDTEQINLASNDAFIGYLKYNDTQDLLYSVAKEVNPASLVKENCIGSTTASKTATESSTELDISCSSDCSQGSDPVSREVLGDAGCVNSQANTTVSSAPRNDIIEGITGINRAVLCDADMHGHGISGGNKDGQSGHNSGERKLAKNNLSVAKLSSDQALSNIAIHELGGSGNDNYQNEIISLNIGKQKEDERLDQETSKEDINKHDLDFLHQKLESLPTTVAKWDFITSSKPNKNNETDRRLGELLSVQRQTCGIMMKNVLRRADQSKNLYKTTKTKPTVHADNRNHSPLFCMITGSKIEARVKQAPNKPIHRSKTQMACRGHEPTQQRQNQQVELSGRHQTMSNSLNVSQVPENRRNRSRTYKQSSSKDDTERSKPVDNVNANEDKDKSTKTELQSKRNVRTVITEETVEESNLTEKNINDKHSFTKTTAGQERNCKYLGQCNDKLTFSKIPRLVKTFIFSETKHQQENKNTNYTGVSENLEQSNSGSCDLSLSLTQRSQSSSRAPKGRCIYTDSHHDELIFTDATDVCLETHDLGESPKGITLQETRHILAEVNDDIVTERSCNENELPEGLDSEQDLHRTNEFEEKSAGNYINSNRVTFAHTKESVLSFPPTQNIPHMNSPQLWKKNCHCHSLKTYFNQKDLSHIQHTCFETDRSVSIYQCSIYQPREILCETDRSVSVCQCSFTQPCEILCESDRSVSLEQHSITQQDEIHCITDRSVSLSQCPATQPHEKLCETERSFSVYQFPVTHSREMICETHKSVSVLQISEPFTKSISNEQASDKSTDPTGDAQTKRTDHDDKQFDEDTHLPRRVSERQSSSGRLLHVDNRQHPYWNNRTKEFIKPFTDVTNADTASADKPTFSDVREDCSTVSKKEGHEKSTILTNTNSSQNITRSDAESTEYSRNSLKMTAISEEKSGDCVKECNISEVNTCDTINSGEVRTRKHVYKSPLYAKASFRSMVQTLMNQSEDFASDSDNESSLINDRRKRKKVVFPVSPLEKGISNFTKADPNEANYQTLTDVEKAACYEGERKKPTYAELKARALAKALPVLSKLKVQSGKYMQIIPTTMEFPCDSIVERTVLTTSQIHPSVDGTSVNYKRAINAELFTNDCFEATDNSSGGTYIMNESYFNRCSIFNINNSKSEQEIDLENDNTGPGQDYSKDKSANFNTDKINLAQKDVSVIARGNANTHQSSNAGKTNLRRKCRIPVRQNRDPRVLLDEVEIPQKKHFKKPRDFVMILKSKNKNKGSVAAALSLIQPTESNMLNTEDTKPITELPKHVQVFARGNGVVVEVCADSSSTAVSVSNIEQARAPLAERIRKYQQERPRNIFAGRYRSQDDSTLGSASKRSKKISDNISSCSEVSSIASNLQVHVCEQASKSFNPCKRIDNIPEMDMSTPRSSKTFKVSNDEDAVTDVKSNQKLQVREDSVSHEDIAIQTSDNTSASAVTMESTQLTVHKKDATEQVSMSSSNKSNSSAKEVNENAAVAQSNSLGENDSSYTEGNSKCSEKQLVSGSLTKARTYLSEARKRYLMKNVAFSSKLPKTTSESMKNSRHNCTTSVSKHAVHTLHGRYNETLEKVTKSDTTNSKRQQRYKRLERPVCAQEISQNASINLLSNCQLFSPSSQESNEPCLQQDPNSTLVNQNSPLVNIQNIVTHQRLSNSRNTNSINDQDDSRQHTILTSSQSYRNATCPLLDGDEMRFDGNSGVALKKKEYCASFSNTCVDKQKQFETRSSRNFWERDEDCFVSPEYKRPHSGSASHVSFHSSQCELQEIQKSNQTELAAGNETALFDTFDSNRSKQSEEFAVSQLESNIEETKDAFVSLTGTSKLNLQDCAHVEHNPDSGSAQIQLVNNGDVQREVSCKQVSIKRSETDCGGFKKSTKLKNTDTYENLTLERTSGDFCNISITDCPSQMQGEAMKSNRPSSSESCHILNKGRSVKSSKNVQHPGYTVILPSLPNRQAENIFSPIPATLSPTTSVKHPRTRSLLLKSMVFTAEDSSSKSSLRSNENSNAHVCLATRRSDSGNPLSMFGHGSPHSVAGNSHLTDDICLRSRTSTSEDRTAPVGEWQTDKSINSTLRMSGHGEHNHVNLPQKDSEDESGRSARINNKTPRLSHPKNCFSACLQTQTSDRSTGTVTRLGTLRTSSDIGNENGRTENVETLNAKQLSSFPGKRDDKDKITENMFSNNKQDSANKTSRTLELVPLRTDLCTTQMSSLMPTPIKHKAMTTPRKGKLTLTSLEMTDYERLSPEVVNSCGSLSYSTTSQESAAAMYVYSTHERVPVLAGHLINSNDAHEMPCSSALSSRHKKSLRTSEEIHESAKPNLPPMSPGQSGLTSLPSKPSGLPPLSSKQSGLPHRPQFKRYY